MQRVFTSRLLLSILIIGTALITVNPARFGKALVYADEYDKLQEEKNEKLEEKAQIEGEVENAEGKRDSLGQQLDYYKGELNITQNSLEQNKKLISELDNQRVGKEEMLEGKMMEKNSLVRDLYKKTGVSPLELFLMSDNLGSFSKTWQYYQVLVQEGRRQILETAFLMDQIKKQLEEEAQKRAQLEAASAVLASQTVYYGSQVQKADAVIADLNSQLGSLDKDIAEISAKQEALIREKLSATSVFTTVGETEDGRETLPDPGFSPAFAVFSYGYPHRVGMSQYGAFGRSKAGQSAKEILKAYYSNIEIKEVDVPEKIRVTGNFNGEIDFEDNYLKGIAEMPASWGAKGGMEALKAQAIAARTYALAYTRNGEGSICDSQSCQVYLKSKAESDSAKLWHEAVEETKGQVMLSGGSPIKAWYASTHGCYSRLPTDFDVKWNSSPPYIKRIRDVDGSGRCFEGSEYANSPWFHKAWYGGSDGHPWLTEEELRDLLNASRLPESYNEKLSHPDNDGWSAEEVEKALKEEGKEPLGEIKKVEAVFAGEGYTQTLEVSHGGGTAEIDAQRFRKVFVLRSRGHLALWSSLFDIESR